VTGEIIFVFRIRRDEQKATTDIFSWNINKNVSVNAHNGAVMVIIRAVTAILCPVHFMNVCPVGDRKLSTLKLSRPI